MDSSDHLHRIGHTAEIGADVEDIRNDDYYAGEP